MRSIHRDGVLAVSVASSIVVAAAAASSSTNSSKVGYPKLVWSYTYLRLTQDRGMEGTMKNLTFVARYVRCAITKESCVHGVHTFGFGVDPSHLPMHCWGPGASPQLKGPHRSVGVHDPNSRGHTEAWESITPTQGATPKPNFFPKFFT